MKELLFRTFLILTFLLILPGARAPERQPSQGVAGLLGDLPPWWQDVEEDPTARAERLLLLARAKVDVAAQLTCTGKYAGDDCQRRFPGTPPQLVTALMTVGWWESRLARHIHAGECGKDECDGGAARSVYQVQKNGTYPEKFWEEANGITWHATRAATMAAALSIASAWHACYRRNRAVGVFSAYASGKCGTNHHGVKRNSWYQRHLPKVRQAISPGT